MIHRDRIDTNIFNENFIFCAQIFKIFLIFIRLFLYKYKFVPNILKHFELYSFNSIY